MNPARTVKGVSRLAGAVVLGMLSSHPAFAESVSIEVTTTKQQTFQGFGVEISDTLNTFLPRGGRADKAGSTAAALYDKLLSSNSQYSLNLSYLRLDLPTDLYKSSSTASYDLPTAIIKTGQADIIKAAKSRNPKIKLCYVPGTPPFWMKENGANYDLTINGTTIPATTTLPDAPTANHLLASKQGDYAAFLGQFCTDFKANFGFPFDVLSLQNEPDVNAGYNSCLYPSNSSVDNGQAATYTGMLNSLRQVPPFSSWSLPQLWGPDMGSAKQDATFKNADYIAAVADLGQLNALCLHDYGSAVSDLPEDYHRNNLPVNMTEVSLGQDSYVLNGTISQPWMAATMTDIFCKDANVGHVASWFWFRSIAKSDNTGECLIAVNLVNNPKSVYKYINTSGYPADHAGIALNDNTKYPATGGPYATTSNTDFSTDWTLTSKYFAFRRLTQSIQPGSVSMKTLVSPYYASYPYQDDVYSAAFKLPSGKYCIVVTNQSSKQYAVNLKVDALTTVAYTSLKTYYTADGNNDVSWPDTLTNGVLSTVSYPYSVVCYVQQ